MAEEIRNITPFLVRPELGAPVHPKPEAPAGQPSFGEVLRGFIQEVDRLQKVAEEATQRTLSGEAEDVHQVVIAMEEAQVAFRLLMEVRNKMVEAYKEIIRMQV